MSRHFGFVNIVAILFIAALLLGYMQYVSQEKDEIERLKLSYAIDYATDAGAMAMLNTGNLDMDYTKQRAVTVNPALALDTFLDVFAFNYDLYPSAENKALIKDFIPVAAVAGYDGYYLASHQLVTNEAGNYPETPANEVEWDLVFGMKMPYLYTYGGTSYGLNMGMEETLALTDSTLSKIQGLPPTSTGSLSRGEAQEIINNNISNDMAYQINETNTINPYWKNFFYIPSQLTTFSGVNPIEGPSLLVLVQNVTLTTSKPISGFSIAGSKIDRARMVLGYTRNGMKYYAFADKAPVSTEVDPVKGIVIENIYSTAKEAALAGYYFDTETELKK
ncbi:hypothetical protein ABN764_16135 [Paenibacillaceae sp. P-4]|uniref:hypothetical protein n=1 Tax=Paenibacillaceae bacterium P-4 TaxID=3160969 RepID=UPI0032E81124